MTDGTRHRPDAERTDPLIYTQEFSMLLGRAQRAPLIRRELSEDYVPAGYSADQVWDALTVIRRSQAIVSPDTHHEGGATLAGWHTVPESTAMALRQIAALTQRGSSLDGMVSERSGRRFITQQYVEEALTNLLLDAFPSTYEQVRAALLGEAAPADDAQRLALNFHRIMNDMEEFAGTPFDASLLEALYDRLTQGVSRVPPMKLQHSPLEPIYQLGPTDPAHADQEMLEFVADVANDRLTEPAEHPILVSMLVNCQFWHHPIFPSCNNLMGCIASRLYLYRHGYPVFRYVPKIYLLWAWKQGRERSPRGYRLEESYAPDGRLGIDWTAYYDTVMQLMLEHVRTMERTMGSLKAVDDRTMGRIDDLPDLNARQAQVLRQAVIDPGREFRIAWHQREFGVVYSTAHSDLEKLTKRGFLARTMSGSAYVYRPAKGLAALISRG